MCPSYKDYFKAEGHPYVKHITHFHCKCDQEHKHFVHFCGSHPFGTRMPAVTDHTGTIRKNVSVTKYMLTKFVSIVFLLSIA